MPLQEDYQVTLDAFHGPLDLLLYLIRRAEVDVHDIPIAQITEQYLTFLRQLDDIDVEQAGEFLVMAATLIEVKSRSLAPVQQSESEDEADAARPKKDSADPRLELVQQLLAYQRFRTASEELSKRRAEFSKRYSALPARLPCAVAEHDESELLELEDVHLLDLADAYEHIIESIDFSRLGDHTVEIDDTPIALHQEDLLDRLNRTEMHHIKLQDAFEGRTRGQRVGLFLATLELVRMRRITCTQEDLLGEIVLALRPHDAEEASGV